MNVALSPAFTATDVAEFMANFEAWLADFEPGTWDGVQARDAVELFARLGRLANAATALAGRRVDDTTAWAATGDRTATAYLARVTGTSLARAGAALTAASGMDSLAATNERFRRGELSTDQAAAIAVGATASPESEQMLLDDATTKPLGALQAKARELETRADHRDDPQARRRAKRNFRRFNGDDCMRQYIGELPPDMAAEVESVWDTFTERVFRNARAQGQRESHAAYMADGLLAMARAANARLSANAAATGERDDATADTDTDNASDDREDFHAPVRANFVIRIDIGPLLRGDVRPGEVCEIAGVGPIDVETARKLMSNAVLDFVISDGIDIRTVAHAGRKATRHQLAALLSRDYVCEIEGCETRERLEIDHIDPYADTKRTSVETLGYKCPHCHDLKTHKRWTDGPLQPNGRRNLIPPPTPPPPDDS